MICSAPDAHFYWQCRKGKSSGEMINEEKAEKALKYYFHIICHLSGFLTQKTKLCGISQPSQKHLSRGPNFVDGVQSLGANSKLMVEK